MFHGVDVAIFDVAAIFLIVLDQVLPETALPDAPFTARPTNFASPLGRRYRLGEYDLDQSPARRKIRVAFRQRPNRVDVVGQYDECVDAKWMPLARAAGRFTQRLDLVYEETAATIEQICREEPASSRDKCDDNSACRRLTGSSGGAIK